MWNKSKSPEKDERWVVSSSGHIKKCLEQIKKGCIHSSCVYGTLSAPDKAPMLFRAWGVGNFQSTVLKYAENLNYSAPQCVHVVMTIAPYFGGGKYLWETIEFTVSVGTVTKKEIEIAW